MGNNPHKVKTVPSFFRYIPVVKNMFGLMLFAERFRDFIVIRALDLHHIPHNYGHMTIIMIDIRFRHGYIMGKCS